jgi:hypothetical protein
MSYQLEFCKKCVNKSFSSSQGIVCGLTDKKPTFLTTCPDFEKDVKEERKIEQRKAIAEESDYQDENGKSVPAWRVALTVIITLVAIIRIFMRCSGN